MNSKKNLLVKVLMAVMLAICSVGFIGCKKDNDKKPTSYGETGIYYFTAVEDEYQLTLQDGKYTLTIEDAYLTGKYSYDGITLNLYADGEGSDIIGSIDGTILTISYNGGIYKFYKKVDYTVTFDVDGGTAMQPVTVVNGMTMTKPADPVKEGFYFVGWYADKAYTKPFAFGSDIITANTTIYARFVAESTGENEYTATLYVDGEVLESKTTVGGVLYNLPVPTKADDTFVGWWISDYQQADMLTYEYKDEAVLTQDVNLYAVWASDGLQVSVTATGVTWSALKTGVEYTVVVKYNGNVAATPYTTTELSMTYDFAAAEAGDYTVSVEAEGKTTVAYYCNKALARVSNFTVSEPSTLVFGGVANAEKYLITVVCGNSAHTHTDYDNGNSTTFSFAGCDMKEGGIEFVVKAMATGYVTSVSETYVYNLQLDAVSGVNYDATTGELTWNAVENASSYEVKVTAGDATDSYTVSGTTLSLKQYTGAISVKVKAVCAGYNSAAATEYSCTIATLPAPVVSFAAETISWTAVDGAKSYVVKIGDKEYPVAEGTELALPAEYKVDAMAYAISVQAVSEDTAKNSFYSDAVTVTYGEIAELTYSENNLRWSAVGGAYSFLVKLNGEDVATPDSTAKTAAITFAKTGANTLTLYAYDNDGNELDVAEITVEVYQISLDVRGGSSIDNVYAAIGDKLTLAETTYEGYDFAGWYDTPNGPAGNGAKFDMEKDVVTGPMTLYAYWTPAAFEVELMVGKTVYNAETEEYEYNLELYAVETVYYRQNYTLSIPTLDDPSKIFGGWYEDDDKSSYQYTDAMGISTGIWTKLGGHTLFAGWIDVLSYELFEDASGKSWHVTGGEGTKYAEEITVPAAYTDPVTKDTYPVTEIKTRAFAECNALRTLNIPDTLQSIFLAFGSTTSTMSTGSALYECRNLQNINVYCVDEDGEHDENSTHETYYSSVDGLLIRHSSPNTETLEYGVELAFVPYNRTGTLVVPDIVEHIPQRTLYNLRYKKVIIPASVGRIGDRAFYRSNFEEIIFEEAPEGVDEKPLHLSEGTLNDMNNLTKIVIPTRVGDIDLHETNMFTNDNNLLKIDIAGRPTPEQAASNAYYTSVDGVVCNYDGTKLVYVSKHTPGVFTVPASVEVIAERAFLSCWDLEGVIIKDNVKLIETDAFKDARALNSIVFDYDRGSLSIESKAFYGLEEVSSIEFPEQLAYIGSHAFGGMTKLQTVTINGASDAILEWGAFAEESGRNKGYVTTVNLGANAPAFEVNSVFYGCQLYVLNIDKANQNFNVDDQGVLYNKEATTILYYPFGLTANYVIPNTVTTIGQGVFENRANIKSIEIPANVTEIGFNAFKNCVALETLTFAERTQDLVIRPSAFAGCLALTSVSFPEGMTSVESWAFANCSNITSVTLSSTITNFILSDAFYGCKKIKSVNVASTNSVYGIQGGILYEKDGNDLISVLFVPETLTGAVEIPSTVTYIGEGMFRGKTGITSISFENNTASADLVLGDSVFEGMSSLTDVRLPDGLTVIPTNAFKGSSITSVYVPSSVIEVMPGAFANCANLASVTIAAGSDELVFADATLTTGAFYNTPKLTSIELPDRMAALGKYMFAYSSVSEIGLPAYLDIIGEGAFANNKAITSFAMPDTVTTVESFAFSGCTALEEVTLSSQLTSIPDYLFGQAAAGTGAGGSSSGGGKDEGGRDDGGRDIVPPRRNDNTPKYRDDEIIVDDGTVRLSENVTAATALKSITIPELVESIGLHAFHGCKALTTVTFASQENLGTLGDYAFAETGITAFNMPNSVTTIGAYQFIGATKLATLTISNQVTVIPTYMCGEMTLDIYNMGEAYPACASLESITIPASVTEIGEAAFKNASALSSVTIEENTALVNIGMYAFAGSGIKELDLSTATAAAITLGNFAFAESKLTTVKLPLAVTSFGQAFAGCNYITEFEIANDGNGSIDDDIFNVDAESLVVYNGNKTEIRLYVGNATEFEIPDGVKKIHYNAFRSNQTLEKVTIPASVATIEDAAFALCTNLKTVEFAKDSALTSIGFRAFAFSGLTNISIPASVVSMGTHTIQVGMPSAQELLTYKTWVVEKYGQERADGIVSQLNAGWDSTSTSAGWNGRVFESCVNLTQADVQTTYLCAAMFKNCYALANVTLNNNTPSLKGSTFENCKSLTSFTFPQALNSVGKQEFYGAGLTSIHVPAGLSFSSTPRLVTYSANGASMFQGCENLTTATMDDSYKVIPYCFFASTGIKTFKLPASIRTIGEGAFNSCENLESIEFPATYAEGTTLTIMSRAFGYSPKLSGGVDFSNTPVSFTWATNTAGTNFSTASEVFANCEKLEWVKLPDTVKELGMAFFLNCKNLRSVETSGLKVIKSNCFVGCEKLESITLADDATMIGYAAFENCTSLTEIVIPDSVTTLEDRVFKGSGIQSITIGAGITYIPSQAFFESKLKTVHIPATVEMIEPSAFIGCSDLVAFSVDPANRYYKSGDFGELYDSTNVLMCFPAASAAENGTFVMPTMSILGAYAFYGAKNLTSVTVSPATSVIPIGAFQNSSISNVELSTNVTRIGAFAFKNCVNLVEINLPSTIVDPMEAPQLDDWIFNWLSEQHMQLDDGTMFMGVDEAAGLGEGAFEGCTSLKTVNIPKYMLKLAPKVFKGCTSLKTIELPEGLEIICHEAFAESGLEEIVIPETVITIGTFVDLMAGGKDEGGKKKGETSFTYGSVFANCTSLRSVVFKNAYVDVYFDAFIGCTALESVTLANGWTTIADGMFNGCTALNIELPDTIETIGKDAFAGWTAEQTITISMPIEKANLLWGEGWNGEATVVEKK